MRAYDKKFAETVFDLTNIANFLAGMFPDSREVDSRAVFCEVYDLAVEFEMNLKEDDDYMTKIEEFGRKRLSEFFGLEDL